MTRRAYLYFGLTFLCGVIVGATGLFFYASRAGIWHRRPSRQQVVQRMTRDLDLSPDQVRELGSLLDERDKKYHQLEDQVRVQFDAAHEETRGRIRQILRPEQAAKFDALVRQHDAERRHRGP